MGKYHPHGDSSIYDALVHMSKDYALMIPLVDGHGNFGSIDGDGAAAIPRYTETRLSPGQWPFLSTWKRLIDFMPNFDGTEKEPVAPGHDTQPADKRHHRYSRRHGDQYSSHNPDEVIDGVIAYMDNPEISTRELMNYIPAPDFPTGGTIINVDEMEQIYETGEGKIRIRAKTEIKRG